MAIATTARRVATLVAASSLFLATAAVHPAPAGARSVVPSNSVLQLEPSLAAPFPFDENECGPPSTTIPGPPPELIVVGQPMSDSWLMCYIKRDFEGQTFFFDQWGEIRKAMFQSYPVECWTPEADPGWEGQQTEGIIAQTYGWNLDRTQYVRFTYRIQLDGDYINNCQQEILPAP